MAMVPKKKSVEFYRIEFYFFIHLRKKDNTGSRGAPHSRQVLTCAVATAVAGRKGKGVEAVAAGLFARVTVRLLRCDGLEASLVVRFRVGCHFVFD